MMRVALPRIRTAAAMPVHMLEARAKILVRERAARATARRRPGATEARSTAYQCWQWGQWPLRE